MVDYAVARQNMIESQLRANGVTEPEITAAFAAVPRELFVPPERRSIAYIDEDLLLSPGRWLMEPMVFGKLVLLARPARSDRVLHLCAGTGYGSAVLARLVASVVAVEDDPELAAYAARTLAELAPNATVVRHPASQGHPDEAPYDVILIEGAVEEVPATLQEQLAEGGRLVTVVRRPSGFGRGVLFERERGLVSDRPVFDAASPVLPEFARRPGFVF